MTDVLVMNPLTREGAPRLVREVFGPTFDDLRALVDVPRIDETH